MIIIFTPIRDDRELILFKRDDNTIIINSEILDFSNLTNDSILPKEAINCEWISNDVKRVDNELIISILLPHGSSISKTYTINRRFPLPLLVVNNGIIPLPE